MLKLIMINEKLSRRNILNNSSVNIDENKNNSSATNADE